MFQLIGGTLAACAIVVSLGGDLLTGMVLAFLTFVWVVKARPARSDRPASKRSARPAPVWNDGYATPAGR